MPNGMQLEMIGWLAPAPELILTDAPAQKKSRDDQDSDLCLFTLSHIRELVSCVELHSVLNPTTTLQ
jgi:hypothetical protein